MSKRQIATQLFKAEQDVKAAKRRVETLQRKVAALAKELEAPTAAHIEASVALHKAS